MHTHMNTVGGEERRALTSLLSFSSRLLLSLYIISLRMLILDIADVYTVFLSLLVMFSCGLLALLNEVKNQAILNQTMKPLIL